MAIIIETNLHTGRQNPWAYEIPTTIIDAENAHHNIILSFKSGEPTQEEINNMIAFWKVKIEIEEETVIAEDGVEI